jgi:hypothetical protein
MVGRCKHALNVLLFKYINRSFHICYNKIPTKAYTHFTFMQFCMRERLFSWVWCERDLHDCFYHLFVNGSIRVF